MCCVGIRTDEAGGEMLPPNGGIIKEVIKNALILSIDGVDENLNLYVLSKKLVHIQNELFY